MARYENKELRVKDYERAVQLYQAGWSVKEIASEIRASCLTVSYYLKLKGVWNGKSNYSSTPEIENLIQVYKLRKITRDEIVKRARITKSALYRKLYHRGIEIWDDNTLIYAKYIPLYKKRKMTLEEIAEMSGVKKYVIYSYLRNKGVFLWDVKRRKPYNKKLDTRKYFSWSEFKNHLFLSYNKD